MAIEKEEGKVKAKPSLKAGLDRSANKKGLTGKARHRYIGGAIHNMGLRGKITIKARPKKPTTYKQHSLMRGGHKPVTKTTLAHVPPQRPVDKHDKRPAIQITRTHQPLHLVVKKNGPASNQKGYPIFSVYNKTTGGLHSSGTYPKRSSADKEAKIAMDADRQRLARMKIG
jgi:hypothetical protein